MLLARKNIAIGNRKLTEFAELKDAVIMHIAAVKKLRR
jgi:hypothetical protein